MSFTAIVAMASKSFNIASVYGVRHSHGDDVCGGDGVAGLFIERHDDQSLIVVRRTIAREFANRAEKRFLDVVGAEVAALEERALESLEAERLAVVVECFDQSVAIENE